ncbi:peptidase C45 acyl-coenzyme A:6-aminopenicillanic acid acyl-transferase [Gracilibacillus halophilus YIM-C55.5]|uniref:Peptidase C45 acyl-coenzyme A:6-aminopenicillanic acid acyl-transferase n=1 Tax=Gracilibacillus halophilus YIM-C55.5 TaxID=1308866 RepID=N4WHL0_9BACI|nr:C45 family peptidase [Gracilibacillus halophilus]ENH95667.1 peptidase C45 acyl-coenzyme A:6-aminopenicillanic acid acyl-transferase [Gracilibacillus halophilus YIM-C55.5]
MKQIYTDLIQFRGTHYDFGYKQGEHLRNSYLVANRNRQWQIRKPRFRIGVKETKEIFRYFNSSIWEELEGLRDSLNWSMDRVLLEFGGYRLNIQRSGCSIFVGNHYMIRNYDYHPKTYDGRYVVFQPTDNGYASIGVSQRVTGRSDGMNEKGLALGYTFINRKRPGNGFVCHMVGRLVLENCKNVDEAAMLLKEIPHRGSFSYVLSDAHSEKATIVETSPRGVKLRSGNVCTNHFEYLTSENRHFLKDSYHRLSKMEQTPYINISRDEAFQLLNSSQYGIFSTQYHNWAGTIHTSAYCSDQLKTWFTLGSDQEPAMFDFGNWLQGHPFTTTKITGEIETDIPFLHMEKADWFHNT